MACVTKDDQYTPGIQAGPSGTIAIPVTFERTSSGVSDIRLRGAVVVIGGTSCTRPRLLLRTLTYLVRGT